MALTQVQTGMIADSAITDAKIAAMASSKLSGQVPSANAVAGNIIQLVMAETNSAAAASTTSTTAVNSGLLDLTITPKQAGSKIFVEFKNNIRHVNSDADNWGGGTFIYRSINGGAYAPAVDGTYPQDGNFINGQATGGWADSTGITQYLDSPSYTVGQSITYQLWFKKTSRGSGGWYVHHLGGLASYMANTRIIALAWELKS